MDNLKTIFKIAEHFDGKIAGCDRLSLAMDIEDIVNKNNLQNELIIVGHDWGSIVGWALISRGNINVKMKFIMKNSSCYGKKNGKIALS